MLIWFTKPAAGQLCPVSRISPRRGLALHLFAKPKALTFLCRSQNKFYDHLCWFSCCLNEQKQRQAQSWDVQILRVWKQEPLAVPSDTARYFWKCSLVVS